MVEGQRLFAPPTLEELCAYGQQRLQQMPEGTLRLVNPHRYKVAISPGIDHLRRILGRQH